jgi:diaminopimelate epimerase
MSACGNDFLLIESSLAPTNVAAFTRRICDRHEGVGADGVEWMFPHTFADLEIRLINADGSPAEISGNGTRCAAAYVCSNRGKERISILTGAGVKVCTLVARAEAEYEFESEMGEASVATELTLQPRSGEVCGIPVSMGNPHYVIFVPEFPHNWQTLAAEIQQSSNFPQGVNVEYVVVKGKRDVHARFFERGAGETQSSGTGSCACAVAAIAAGRAGSPVRVHAPGGTQTVRLHQGKVFLRGAARFVCRGDCRGEFFVS